MFAAVDDVSGQFSQAEGQLVSEIEKSSEKDEESSEEKKRAAEFAERVHQVILPEGVSKSFSQPYYYYSIPTLDNHQATRYRLPHVNVPAVTDAALQDAHAGFCGLE